MPDNEVTAIMQEYLQKQNLRKLGYVFDGSKLSAFKAECFQVICSEFNAIEGEEMRKARRG